MNLNLVVATPVSEAEELQLPEPLSGPGPRILSGTHRNRDTARRQGRVRTWNSCFSYPLVEINQDSAWEEAGGRARRMHNISARKWYTRWSFAWVAADCINARNPAFTFIPGRNRRYTASGTTRMPGDSALAAAGTRATRISAVDRPFGYERFASRRD